MVVSIVKRKAGNIKKAFTTGIAVGPSDNEHEPYRVYNVSLLGILQDTKTSMPLNDTLGHIIDCLETRNVYIKENDNKNNRGQKRNDLIEALNESNPNIEKSAESDTVYLRQENILGRRDYPFLAIQKKSNEDISHTH